MSTDVLLYAETETEPTPQALEAARDLFRRSDIAEDYTADDGFDAHWYCLEFEEGTEWSSARVVANVTTRYYGIGYERGDWPSIYGAIRLLQAAFPDARVCYGGGDGDAPEFTEERAAELWRHFTGADG